MSAGLLILGLRTRGIELWCEGDQLRYRAPRGALRPQERAALLANKPELLRLLAPERHAHSIGGLSPDVAWRLNEMRRQVPAHGPIPPLVARLGSPWQEGCCYSCNDPLSPERVYRCDPCIAASKLACSRGLVASDQRSQPQP